MHAFINPSTKNSQHEPAENYFSHYAFIYITEETDELFDGGMIF